MGKVFIFGMGGVIVVGLIALAIVMIGGVAPKITSWFWTPKRNKETTHDQEEVSRPDDGGPRHPGGWV